MQNTVINLDALQVFANITSFLTAFILGLKFSQSEQKNLMEIYFIIANYVIAKLIIQFFAAPLNVEIAEAVAKNDNKTIKETINSVGKLALMLGLTLMTILAAFSKTLLYVLHKNAFIIKIDDSLIFDQNLYNKAIILFILFLFGQFGFGFSKLFGNALIGAGATKKSAYGFGFSLVIILITTIIFVYLFDIIGAGISTLIASLSLLPFIIIQTKRSLKIKFDLRVLRQIPQLTLIFIIYFYFPFTLNSSNFMDFIFQLILVIFLTIIILMILIPFFGVYSKKDFEFIEELLNSLKFPFAKYFANLSKKFGMFLFKINPLNKNLERD